VRGGVSRGRTALLGLDVGTTTVKALLVAPDGEPLGLHVAPYPAERASDQPEEWWEAVLRAVRGLDVASRRVDIAAVGVCGRGSGLALLDRRRDPIPAPWARVRARAAALGLPATRRFRRVAQWGRLLRALAQESPAASAAVVLGPPREGLRRAPVDGSHGHGSGRRGVPRVAAPTRALGCRPRSAPADPTAGIEARGACPRAARTLGLPAGVPVAVGTHDGVAANVGAGMLRAGEGCVTLGTNAVLRMNTTGPVDGRWTAVPFTYPLGGGGYTSGGDVPEAGATMAWLVRTVGAPAPVVSRLSGPGRRDRTSAGRFFTFQARLDDLAAAVPAGAEGLGFLPDVGRGASLVGLRPGHGPGHLARAIMEGTAFALGDVLEALVRRGQPVRALRLTGGGSRSRVWTEIVAAILARPIGLVRPEASARGAAVLAAVVAGVWPDVMTATRRMVVAVGQVTPDPAARRRYGRLRAGWVWACFGVARSS